MYAVGIVLAALVLLLFLVHVLFVQAIQEGLNEFVWDVLVAVVQVARAVQMDAVYMTIALVAMIPEWGVLMVVGVSSGRVHNVNRRSHVRH